MSRISESIIEVAAPTWLRELGYAVLHGPDIAAGESSTGRSDPNCRDAVLDGRLHGALARLNRDLPQVALADAYRKLLLGGASLLAERVRPVHRTPVEGAAVGCQHTAIVSCADRSTFLEVSKTKCRPIEVVTPTGQVMQAFESLARPVYERLALCVRESPGLAALRDTLLPVLMSGDLRLKGVERVVEVLK